jgi:hypothetical protein
MAKTLADFLPYKFRSNRSTRVDAMLNVPIKVRYNWFEQHWPGDEENVRDWVLLENGYCVGWNEKDAVDLTLAITKAPANFTIMTERDKNIFERVMRRINCPHLSLELVDGRWTFFYRDPASGISDSKVMDAGAMKRYNPEYWILKGRNFVKQHYTYPCYEAEAVITRDGVVHNIHMTSHAEEVSFKVFANFWYNGAPRVETTDVPHEARTVHQSLWDFYAAIGWDYKRKRFIPSTKPFLWPYAGQPK